MKRTVLLTALGAAVLAIALPASAAPGGASLVIRHQVRGCHSWSLNGGAWKATQHIRLARGGSLVVTNNDVMFHKVVKVSGPAVVFKLLKTGSAMKGTVKLPWAPGLMGRPGATLKVTFPKAGVYRLVTKFGEDYMPMGATLGEDNVLHAIVTVA
jgi:plastocyanin